jgi:DNA-binding transcriptional LysR family regulator
VAECRIGGGTSVLEWLLIPNLATITAAAPEARFNLLHMRTDSVIRALLDHTLDFGIVRKTALAPGLDFHEIGKIDYSLFVPKAWIKRPFKPQKEFLTEKGRGSTWWRVLPLTIICLILGHCSRWTTAFDFLRAMGRPYLPS